MSALHKKIKYKPVNESDQFSAMSLKTTPFSIETDFNS